MPAVTPADVHLAGSHEDPIGLDAHPWEAPRQVGRGLPVRSRLPTVQQTRLSQNECSRADTRNAAGLAGGHLDLRQGLIGGPLPPFSARDNQGIQRSLRQRHNVQRGARVADDRTRYQRHHRYRIGPGAK
jgi:hypothetical protein